MNEPNECKNNACDYKPTLKRDLRQARNPEEIRYGQLWAELEMPEEQKTKERKK